ncbi:acyl-CoA dehydrogenase family protein, partial [Streptomyces sp. NPDC096068]|uniref:acyl-CoA dehydrogenase family protein n=1 Tax=Streptomyces sp. NPDC096068 TaxID=3155424 RepID=UPI0033280D02
ARGSVSSSTRCTCSGTRRWTTRRARRPWSGRSYVEDSGLPRLYREAPLPSIWEGSGNVAALDVLRAMVRQPQAVEAFFAEVDRGAGADRRLDTAVAGLRKELAGLGDPDEAAYGARRLVERLALVFQGSLLVRHGSPAVADAFCASRLDGDRGLAFGTLPAGLDTASIIERSGPDAAV